ncbi:MAG: ABC transporter substrate-binding protein [Pseudomonadota bacterium]
MRNLLRSVAAVALIAVPATSLADVESDEPIIIVQNNWTSQLVLSYVVGKVLEGQGYSVEYAPSDSQLQFQAMADNDMDFQVEAWEGSMKDAFEKAVENGMVDAGTHSAETREEWWIPAYVLETCPEATNWEGLDACAEQFATAETKPRGRFVGPPADWGKNYADRVKSLEMDFEAINVGQAATLWAELQSAYDRKEPIVLFNWTPNFIESKFEGAFVDFPKPEAACFDDPSWGPNPNATGDCGAPHSGWLKKAASPRLSETWPGAWKILQKVDFSNAQIADASLMVDVDGMEPEEAAEAWMENNSEVVASWLDTGS